MTKIKQYELDSTIHEDDKVIGTDGNPGVDLGRTKNFTIAALTAYLNTALEVDNMVGGSGTLNTIPMWTPDGTTLGNSIITTDTSLPVETDGIVVNGKFRVEVPVGADTFSVSNEVVNHINTRFNAGIIDSNSSLGTAGQALLSTSTATEWGTFYIGYAQQASDMDIKFGYNNGTNNTTHAVRVYAGSGITLTENAPLGFEISADNQIPADNVAGTGTLNTVPLWTPDGQTIGNSIITQTIQSPVGSANNVILIDGLNGNTNVLDVDQVSVQDANITDTLTVQTIQAQGTGAVYLLGGVQIGDNSSDVLNIISETAFIGAVKDSTYTLGTAGKILVSDASGTLTFQDQIDTTYTHSSAQVGSDAVIRLTDGITNQDVTLIAGSSITLTDDGSNNITIDGVGDTTYTYSSAQDGSDVVLTLTDGTTPQDIQIVAGNSISLTDNGNNQFTIAATGGAANTTYDLVGTYNTNDTILTLQGSDATSDTFTLHAGSGISFGQDAVNGITTIDLDIADNVTGSGTLNTIPLWTPDGQTLGDSNITVDANSNVTIQGGSASTEELKVVGIGSKIAIEATTAGDAHLEFRPNTTGNQAGVFELTSVHPLRHFLWEDNGSEIMRLKGVNGNLGVGTTSPTYKVHVDGTSGFRADNLGTPYFVVSNAFGGTFVDTGINGGTINIGAPAAWTQNLYVQGTGKFKDGIKDTNDLVGTSGQVLISTGSAVEWIDASDLTDNVSGSGTAGKLPYWNPDGTTLADSLITQTSGNSITIGVGATATGSEAISLSRSTARADYSFAHGYESITDGEFSVTLGKGGYTAGDHSAAIGYKGISLGQSAISGGHSSSAGGDGAVALGHNASAGNYGVAKATSTFPNDQTTFDIYGIVGTVAVGTFLRYGPGFDVADPRIEVTQFTDLGNGAATITIASGIRPIAGELLVFEEQTPQRNDHQGGVALGNDAFSLGQGAVALGQDAVADADFAVAIGRTASTSTEDSIALGGGSTKILIQALVNANSYADDTAAAAGGVAIGELYRNGNVVQIRLT